MSTGDAFETELGPVAQRYFGAGYRRSTIALDTVEVEHVESGRAEAGATVVRATASLLHWHRSGAPRIAHVGTVDAIRIAATVASVAVIAAGRAPAGRECELLAVAVRAGAAPDPGTGGVRVEAWLREPGDDAGDRHPVVCTVGALSVEVTLAGGAAPALPRSPAGRVAVEEVLGPREDRYFAEGFRRLTVTASSLSAAPDEAWCTFAVEPPEARPGVIECLVVTSQLAQVALYRAAGVRREATGNLWMRRCSFTSAPGGVRDGVAGLRVAKFTRFQRSGVDQVSASVAVAAFPGWRGTATLAFQVLG
ncbi:AvrD family protein [Leifsonia sp. F6_8S_P_1B]|uniref:AvrD family protein n=1 Tax=Leifsonia williamsii TaxID=3035919 RepID=A0ABT8K9Q1_9MICO|nr:AvrD family protein [Leifsonia williamsii]MDN4614186.1 AvrD family protein [Leifsonia williamsii]